MTSPTSGQSQSKDRRHTMGLCAVYSCLIAYFGLLNVFHFFAPQNYVTRILLGDVVAGLAMDAQFNLIFASLSFYAIYINWAMYFKVDQNNITFLRSVFLNIESSVVPTTSFADRKNSILSTTSERTTAILNQQHSILFQRFALLSINVLYGFVLVLDLCLLVFTPMVMIVFFSKQEFVTFENGLADVRSWILFFLLLAVFLFHVALNYVYWFSFAHGLILFAVIGTTTLTAIYLLFAEHYACLWKALAAMAKPSSSPKIRAKKEAQLCGLLRQNAALFHFVFSGTLFYGANFLIYMGLHVPIAAIFSVEVLFDKHQSVDRSRAFSLSQIVMVGIVCEAVVGTFLIHLYCAYFSKYLHRGGRMLLRFSGTSNNNGSSADLSSQTQIFIWVHLQRLWVRNKYGVTYGGLGLITIGSFFKFVLFFGELLMTSYSLVH
ncbi:hypothetical protein TYRP_003610 [Tyrophagus putrescentiae]|nr:hypothetical protein TYRP_003610 [Tyrophagus putrescentiae]